MKPVFEVVGFVCSWKANHMPAELRISFLMVTLTTISFLQCMFARLVLNLLKIHDTIVMTLQ